MVLSIALLGFGVWMLGDAVFGTVSFQGKLDDLFGGMAFAFLGAVTWPRG